MEFSETNSIDADGADALAVDDFGIAAEQSIVGLALPDDLAIGGFARLGPGAGYALAVALLTVAAGFAGIGIGMDADPALQLATLGKEAARRLATRGISLTRNGGRLRIGRSDRSIGIGGGLRAGGDQQQGWGKKVGAHEA